jgi:hypothetical protein
MLRASPTTLPLVKGRIDTIIDRLDTLYFGSKYPTFQQYRIKLDGIRTQLNGCGSTLPTQLASDMVRQLDSLQNDLPRAYDAVASRGLLHGEFGQDWASAYPEIVQYITFIANRVPEISQLPPPTMSASRAAAPVIPPAPITSHPASTRHHRQPSTATAAATAAPMSLSRTTSHPIPSSSRAAAQAQHPPIFIPHPEYLHRPSDASAPRSMSYAAPVPVSRGHSMPQLVVPASYNHSHNAAGPVARSRSPNNGMYAAAPVPPHLAHLYARSPVLGARY